MRLLSGLRTRLASTFDPMGAISDFLVHLRGEHDDQPCRSELNVIRSSGGFEGTVSSSHRGSLVQRFRRTFEQRARSSYLELPLTVTSSLEGASHMRGFFTMIGRIVDAALQFNGLD